jgi:hypothetical protein
LKSAELPYPRLSPRDLSIPFRTRSCSNSKGYLDSWIFAFLAGHSRGFYASSSRKGGLSLSHFSFLFSLSPFHAAPDDRANIPSNIPQIIFFTTLVNHARKFIQFCRAAPRGAGRSLVLLTSRLVISYLPRSNLGTAESNVYAGSLAVPLLYHY